MAKYTKPQMTFLNSLKDGPRFANSRQNITISLLEIAGLVERFDFGGQVRLTPAGKEFIAAQERR